MGKKQWPDDYQKDAADLAFWQEAFPEAVSGWTFQNTAQIRLNSRSYEVDRNWHEYVMGLRAAIAARDAEIARLKAEVADLLPMLDADAMVISTFKAEVQRLTAGIRDAVEGRYTKPMRDIYGNQTDGYFCAHNEVAERGCLACLHAHLSALLDPQAPDAGEAKR